MLRPNQVDPDRVFALVIDMQEKLLPLIRNHERIIESTKELLCGISIFHLPVLATEQYAKGLGRTVGPLKEPLAKAKAGMLDKPTFSAWAHPPVRDAILQIDRPQVIIAGIEAHICIEQTALDLLARDFEVFVCADAVSSRSRLDLETALERLRTEGAVVTTVESLLFELCHRCDTPQFKAMIEIIKANPPADV